MLSIAFDREAGFIRAYAEGLFTPGEAARGAIDSQFAMAECVEAIGCTRVLMIADGTIQTPEVISEGQKTASRNPCSPFDRRAFVVSSVLRKMQMGRVVRSDQERYFASEAEAIAWLKADLPQAGGDGSAGK
jgi:hypothetical protein